MAINDFRERTPESRNIEISLNADCEGEIVEGIARLELI
jgi:hypothetical protein